jgi:hypothetical protein
MRWLVLWVMLWPTCCTQLLLMMMMVVVVMGGSCHISWQRRHGRL